jgi:Transposase domain (DUF772)
MKQRTLAMMTGFERYTKKTRRALFLEEMERVVPWRELCALIKPHYPKAGNGRPPVGVERMLRIYFLQQWFNLSDPGVEEALYDSVGSSVESMSSRISPRWRTCSLQSRRNCSSSASLRRTRSRAEGASSQRLSVGWDPSASPSFWSATICSSGS